MIYILTICLLIALFFLVTTLFIVCISSEIRAWKREPPKEIKSSTFICKIYIGDIDFRSTTLQQVIRNVLVLKPETRINYDHKTDRFEVDNTNYEVIINNDYLYIYKRELI